MQHNTNVSVEVGPIRHALKIAKYQVLDVMRSRWLIAYSLFFFLVSESLLRFSSDSSKAVVSLLNVVLILIPLASVIFGTIYLYNAREFIELMLTQPLRRSSLFLGMYAGLSIPFALAFVAGCGAPFIMHSSELSSSHAMLILAGVILTFVFIGIASLVTSFVDDKAAGNGLAFAVWLAMSVLYDGVVLFVASTFSDYPLEKVMIVLSALNPIDLARILVILKFDIAALMGYTGAVFEQFFGTLSGMLIALGSLLVWIVAPLWFGMHKFRMKNF